MRSVVYAPVRVALQEAAEALYSITHGVETKCRSLANRQTRCLSAYMSGLLQSAPNASFGSLVTSAWLNFTSGLELLRLPVGTNGANEAQMLFGA